MRPLAAGTAHRAATAALAKLPPPAQAWVRSTLGKRRAAAREAESRPFLRTVDAAIRGFDGKRVVEIGSDHAAATLQLVAKLYSPRELIGLNPAFEPRHVSERIRVERRAAEDSGLATESVDAVFSSSAFEHVHRLGDVLAEMHRVLVPGGLLYSHFGPLWSTSYGHHLWIEEAGRTFTYHDVILPPWMHLLGTPDEVRALLTPDYGERLAGRMTTFIFESPEQNRLFFDDYERIVADSPFEAVFLKGYDAPELAAKYPTAQSPDVLDQLAERFPGRHGFLYDGITLLLRKRYRAEPPDLGGVDPLSSSRR